MENSLCMQYLTDDLIFPIRRISFPASDSVAICMCDVLQTITMLLPNTFTVFAFRFLLLVPSPSVCASIRRLQSYCKMPTPVPVVGIYQVQVLPGSYRECLTRASVAFQISSSTTSSTLSSDTNSNLDINPSSFSPIFCTLSWSQSINSSSLYLQHFRHLHIDHRHLRDRYRAVLEIT